MKILFKLLLFGLGFIVSLLNIYIILSEGLDLCLLVLDLELVFVLLLPEPVGVVLLHSGELDLLFGELVYLLLDFFDSCVKLVLEGFDLIF